MSEITHTTSNGHEIEYPVDRLSAGKYRELLADEFGLDGKTPEERVMQLKDLSQEGVAIMLEKVNALAQGSAKSVMNQDRATRIGDKLTIDPKHRYDVFTDLIETIRSSPENVNPARIGDALAMGVVLLHPFHDGNGRTARLIGLTFRNEFDGDEYENDFSHLIEPRDDARKRGGFLIYGYTPKHHEGFNQSDPDSVSKYLSDFLNDKTVRYTSPYGEAPLHKEDSPMGYEKNNTDSEDEIIENYESFSELIGQLRSKVDDSGLIGSGAHSDVFKVKNGSKDYAVRVVKQVDRRVEIMHSHITAGARARNIDGLEKIVAASYEEGVIISEFAIGNHLQELTVEQMSAIPDDHLDALLATRREAMERGIQFDSHPANVLYDREQGFTDIDYHITQSSSETVNLFEAMKTIIGSLDLTELHLYEKDSTRQEQYEDLKIALLKRVNNYMKEKFNEDEYHQLWQHLVGVVAWRKGGFELHKHNARIGIA